MKIGRSCCATLVAHESNIHEDLSESSTFLLISTHFIYIEQEGTYLVTLQSLTKKNNLIDTYVPLYKQAFFKYSIFYSVSQVLFMFIVQYIECRPWKYVSIFFWTDSNAIFPLNRGRCYGEGNIQS